MKPETTAKGVSREAAAGLALEGGCLRALRFFSLHSPSSMTWAQSSSSPCFTATTFRCWQWDSGISVGLAVLVILNRQPVMRVWPYLVVGAFIWVCVLKSGVHATLAGFATALAVALTVAEKTEEGPLERTERGLSPVGELPRSTNFCVGQCRPPSRRRLVGSGFVSHSGWHRGWSISWKASWHLWHLAPGNRSAFGKDAGRRFTTLQPEYEHLRRVWARISPDIMRWRGFASGRT